MSPVYKRLAWTAAGFAAAIAIAALMVAVRNAFISPADSMAMSGMLAAGDLIMFVLIAGTLGLVPTFFLLRLATESHPRALAWALLALSVTGPLCAWLLMASASLSFASRGLRDLFGAALVLVIGPRAVAAPVMLGVLATALVLARDRRSRLLLSCGLLLEAVPLALLALHFLRLLARP